MVEGMYWGAVAAFGMAAACHALDALRPVECTANRGWWLTLLGTLVLGFVYTNHVITSQGMLDVGLGSSLELMVLVTATLFLLGGRESSRLNRSLGLLLLPILVLILTISGFLPTRHTHVQQMADPMLVVHLLLSVASYGLFSLATVLALLDAFQEHALRKKSLGLVFSRLPSLDRLEEGLFALIRWGFGLLTLSMASGAVYAYQSMGAFFTMSHKVVFSWATWLVFGILLLGHHLQGWRGRRAVRYILIGYIFLWLGYFGVKFVTEILLHR